MINNTKGGVWWVTIEAPVINDTDGSAPRDWSPAYLLKRLPDDFYFNVQRLEAVKSLRSLVLVELATQEKRTLFKESDCRNALETALFYEAQRTDQSVEIAGYRVEPYKEGF